MSLYVVGNNNREDDGDDGKDEQREEEADPSLLSRGTSRDNGLVRVANSEV